MNVYKKEYVNSCGGGLILIAAHSDIEAEETALLTVNLDQLNGCSCAEQIPNTIYFGTEPEVLACNIYME